MKDDRYFDALLEKANKHHIEHKCGGAPYTSYKELCVQLQYIPCTHMLEIGTGTGFLTTILAHTYPHAYIDTIEEDATHVALAKENLLHLPHVTLHHTSAQEYVASKKYDCIIFDGYAPDMTLIPIYKKYLLPCGYLISTNKHLFGQFDGSSTREYHAHLQDTHFWELQASFSDTDIYKKK
ncbi:MAG: methyltransferase [Alphaproteobacteria bacterium]|nr:methyltransferase [Alphaproteobacteria bacterium]